MYVFTSWTDLSWHGCPCCTAPHADKLLPLQGMGSRTVLSKQEEASLIQVVKEYMHMDLQRKKLARQIRRTPTWEELAKYTKMNAG